MIRVLHYGMTAHLGGIETFLMTLYRSMDHSQVQFDFLLNHDQPKLPFEEEITQLGGRVFRVCYGLRENPIKAKSSLKHFFDEHNGEFAAVHLHSCFMGNALLLKYAKKYRIPIRIFHSHNAGDMYPSNSLLKKAIRKYEQTQVFDCATHLFACSEMAGKYMFGDKLFSVIPNAISVDKFIFREDVRKRKRSELGIDDKFVVGFVGRLQYQKNPLFLIDIFQEIVKKEPQSILLIVGTGPMESEVREKINSLGLSDKAMLLGSRTDVDELYQAFDSFLLPSRFEGLGIVYIEAQTSGLPCFASASVVPLEAKVTDLMNYIPLNQSAEIWADEILKDKDTERKDMSAEIIQSGFETSSMADRMKNFYLSGEIGRRL